MKYLVKQVLHFSHTDFIKAVKLDLHPLISHTGLWLLRNYAEKTKLEGKQEKLKKIKVAIEIIKLLMEKQLEHFLNEKKYHMVNKFSPKKLPELQIQRHELAHIYSWPVYAPAEWLVHSRKTDKIINAATEPVKQKKS